MSSKSNKKVLACGGDGEKIVKGEKAKEKVVIESFLSFSLLLLFLAALLAKDLTQEVAMSGLDVAA